MTSIPDVELGVGRHPKVTVVVPTRDRPQLLLRAVAAITEQDYPGTIEVLVLFDQSDPVEIDAPSRPDRHIRTLRNDRTPGLAGARNSGVLAADGLIIGFCDDDDEWLPGKLALQVDLLMANPTASLVACGILVHFRGRDIIRAAPPVVTHTDVLRDRVMEVNPCTALLLRSVMVDDIGLVDESIPGSYAEDYEWLLRATNHGPVLCVSEAYVRVNWHAASFFAERWVTVLAALQYVLARHPDIAGDRRGFARIQGQMAFAEAALGNRRRALRHCLASFRKYPGERRVPVALLVASGAVRPGTVIAWAHSRGRGI